MVTKLGQIQALFVLILWIVPFHVAIGNDLFELSLEQLLDVEISTGSLFSGNSRDASSAVTIIPQDKIALSGAKNLATLLEQHVPGMILMTHSEGNKIGLRGHIAAENYKLLLLVNGKNVTNFVYEGVITEIDQWELGDIERVEVVRGPGSVTYGSGAIAGVINIITKSARSDLPNVSVGLTRNDTYDSNGINLQVSNTFDNQWGIYGFLSYRETKGLEDPNYFSLNPDEPTDIRYVGKGSLANAGPQDFLADTHDRPQIKAHLSLNDGEHFSAWMRYTQSGQVRFFTEKAYELDQDGNELEAINSNNSQTRSFIVSADYRFDFANNTELITSLTYDTQEYIRYRFSNRQYGEKSPNNIKDYAFAQDRITASALYDFTLAEKLDTIIGYEYIQYDIGAPWEESDDHLWIREGSHIISDWDSSVYTQDLSLSGRPNPSDFVEVGDGLRFHTHSHLLESKYTFSEHYKLLYGHRLDYSDVSSSMFSPRLSLISNFNQHNTLVATLQRAQRMMPLRAQYLNEIRDGSSKHETLDSLEFSYTHSGLNNTSINLRTYYNEINAVGYTGSELKFLTYYELFGAELTATYKKDNLEIAFNHAFMETLDVDMNQELKTGLSRNNISFADYYYFTRSGIPILLESYGDGLNNWPQNISKFLLTYSFLDQRLKAHLTAQIYWDYEGSFDEMEMYQVAYDRFDRSSLSPADQVVFEEQYQAFLRERALLEEQDAFQTDYNVNFSLLYTWLPNPDTEVSFKFFVENLLKSSYRYNVSTGSNKIYPERLQFLDKPRMVGGAVQISF